MSRSNETLEVRADVCSGKLKQIRLGDNQQFNFELKGHHFCPNFCIPQPHFLSYIYVHRNPNWLYQNILETNDELNYLDLKDLQNANFLKTSLDHAQHILNKYNDMSLLTFDVCPHIWKLVKVICCPSLPSPLFKTRQVQNHFVCFSKTVRQTIFAKLNSTTDSRRRFLY